MLSFDSFTYFADLLILSLVLYPLHRVLPSTWAKRAILTAGGMYLTYLIAPRLLLFYLVFWGAVAVLQPLVALIGEEKGAAIAMWSAVVAVSAPMVIWKIWETDFVIWFNVFFGDRVGDLSGRLGAIDSARDIIIPIGLSFATFRALDLLVQSSLGVVDRLSPGRVLFFGFFPPVQVIGPIIEYGEVGPRAERPDHPTFEDYRAAFFGVTLGLIKVFVLAFPLEASADVFVFYDSNAAITLWLELVLFAWFFYLNFSGYSDIAIGVARLYGFALKPNFNNPYVRTNPQDFWNSWHMSLTRSAQRNVFVPLGGMRANRQFIAIAATMMIIALWHDISLPLVIFGVYHSLGLIGWRIVSTRRPPVSTPSRLLQGGKIASQFLFLIASFPLLILEFRSLDDFYLALLGVS